MPPLHGTEQEISRGNGGPSIKNSHIHYKKDQLWISTEPSLCLYPPWCPEETNVRFHHHWWGKTFPGLCLSLVFHFNPGGTRGSLTRGERRKTEGQYEHPTWCRPDLGKEETNYKGRENCDDSIGLSILIAELRLSREYFYYWRATRQAMEPTQYSI